LTLYFYQIERLLNGSPNALQEIKFQSEEANTDEYLKEFFKDFLLQNNSINEEYTPKRLIYTKDGIEQKIETKDFFSYEILDVLLPSDLSKELKTGIKDSKKSVYTSPDLYLVISNGTDIYYESVELKSTKDNSIPGSSIQQVSPYEWVIFLKRTEDKVIVATGYYIHTITDKLPFPDRSPRPQIGFNTLQTWNSHYRYIKGDELVIGNTVEQDNIKLQLLEDWQDYLATQWLEIVLSCDETKNEKWFNHAIRKFTLKFMEHYEKLSNEEYQQLKRKLMDKVKKQ